MGIVLQQSHYNLEAMLQDGWTSNYKECCTNMTALPDLGPEQEYFYESGCCIVIITCIERVKKNFERVRLYPGLTYRKQLAYKRVDWQAVVD